MVSRIVLLLMALCSVHQSAFAGQLRTLDISISFDASTITNKTLAGYNFYEDSNLVCKTSDPTATTVSCSFVTENGTHSYELTARFSDGTESSKSPSFEFAIADSGQSRTLQIALSYDTTTLTEKTLAGYRLYEDTKLVCETSDPTATSITCNFVTTDGTHSYQLAAYFTDGTEGAKSEPYAFSISASTSQLNSIELALPTDLEILSSKTLAGYKLYIDTELICQTSDPTATTISCLTSVADGTHIYQISSYYTDGTEGQTSSALQFTIGDTSQLRTIEIALSFDSSAITGKTLTGYNLYENSLQVCKTGDPAATTITCAFITTDGTHTYELTAYFTDGTESPKSQPFEFAIGATTSGGSTGTLAAAITANPTSGTAPLSVSFDATKSTGNIITYSWDFGDGTTVTGATATHTYSIAGTYTTSLQVSDSTGNSVTSSIAIKVDASITQSTPPTAAIASSTAAGEAPLTVTLDGSASTATNATIASYAWDFGDATKASGKTTSHTYTVAGTYSTELIVTDSLGQTGTATTPIVVTQPTTINQAPSASFTATPTQGSTPLTVSFDASSSQDTDGTIASYIWNFGDGAAGSGKTVEHIYTNPATYTTTLQTTDDRGATSELASKSIIAAAAQTKVTLYYEIGELNITSDWVRVNFKNSFTKPAIFVSPPTYNGQEATVVRVRNLNSTGFEIRLQEWDYLDGKHIQETVSFIALEQGQTVLPDGTVIDVGSFNGSTRKQTITFRTPLPAPPVVLTTIISENEKDAVAGRISSVTKTNFAYLLQEQELSNNKHVGESVAYLAWSTGSGSVDNIYFSAALPTTLVTNKSTNIHFLNAFQGTPFLFIEMQTMNDADPAALRIQTLSNQDAKIFIQEEQSKNSETSHSSESVGYLGISPATVNQ